VSFTSTSALADATLSFQTDMHGLTETYRAESSNASRDIAEAVEEAKRKFAALLTKAA
jgi:L-lactate utilization protein LutC